MKYLMVLIVSMIALPVMADTLSLTPPTKYEDGTALNRNDITKFVFYRAGVKFKEIPGNETSTEIPPTCEKVTWFATAVAKGLESKPSNSAIQGVSPKCMPNAPTFKAKQVYR